MTSTLILSAVLLTACPGDQCRTPARTVLRVPVTVVVGSAEAHPVRRLGKRALQIRPVKRVRQVVANRPHLPRRVVKAIRRR